MFRSLRSALLVISLTITVISCQKETDENQVPTVDAGAPQETGLPADSVTLSGSGTDADGQVVAYLWSQVSGPAASVIDNPGSPTTKVRGFASGNYVFQLMVTDNKGATGVDTVQVKVNAPVKTTLTLQPANNPGEVLVGVQANSSVLFTTAVETYAAAWTKNGDPITVRALLKFDLSGIPANATILSAHLYLYSDMSPISNGNLVDANFGTANSMYLQQVTSDWSANTISWTNQPSYAVANQVTIAQTDQSVLDLDIDVKNMVSSMVNENANYGFMFRLQNEITYNSRIFTGSREVSLPAKHPKLVIEYK